MMTCFCPIALLEFLAIRQDSELEPERFKNPYNFTRDTYLSTPNCLPIVHSIPLLLHDREFKNPIAW